MLDLKCDWDFSAMKDEKMIPISKLITCYELYSMLTILEWFTILWSEENNELIYLLRE